MPQARLPDINTAYIMYRREVLSGLKSRNYSSCFGALFGLNALLPKEYRVLISTEKYEEKTKQDVYVICRHCKIETDFKSVKVFILLAPMIETILTKEEYEKVWVCPGCNKNNKLTSSEMVQKVLAEPYFLSVVPKPPERKDGLLDRSAYHNKITVWIWSFLNELDERMAQFRDDNWKKGDEMEEEIDLDSGEELDQ